MPYNITKLLDKCEALTLLCTKTTTHWSFVKFCFNIPLVFTSSAMCIVNSITQDANEVKLPNIIINALSVLIISINNNIRASEKYEIFKKLSQSFMVLCQDIESIENMTTEQYHIIMLKYENLIMDLPFEDVPLKIKQNVSKSFTDAGRHIPINLNGIIANHVVKKRISADLQITNNINEFDEIV